MDLLSRIVDKRLNAAQTNAVQDEQPQEMNPMLQGILTRMGLTPDKIESWIAPIKDAVLGQLQTINTKLLIIENQQSTFQVVLMDKLLTIENKMNEIEANQSILLRDHSEELRTAQMIDDMQRAGMTVEATNTDGQ